MTAFRESTRRTVLALTLWLSGALLTGGLLSGPTAGAADAISPAAEVLRTRVEALAVDPRVEAEPVTDPWFLIGFYERREFTPAWGDDARLDALTDVLRASTAHGLDPANYHFDTLIAARAALVEPGASLARASIDILATDALARLAYHLRFGKVNPELIEPTWNFTRTLAGTDPIDAIQRLVDAPDMAAALDALAPQEERYRTLLAGLAEYREIASAGGWPQMPGGETLRAGMRAPRVVMLRERLLASGDLNDTAASATAEDGALFDASLDTAVRGFQARHGLEPDGVVGPRTLAALNVSAEARIDQLRINLERVRWTFRDLEPRYIISNIARFQTTLIEDGAPIWSTRSVVGRSYRQTPVFRGRMTYLVLNPTWTVPPGILSRDLLPEIRRDPGTLARRNMSVLDLAGRPVDPAVVDWNATRGFPYMIRQEPGHDNALGRVKFMFPNPYHVYMHDTPAQELFDRADRTFSSGCIRLENALELAEILLAESPNWDRAAIDRALADGRERTVTLPRALTVLLIYATVVPENGQLLFLPDVYDRDARLLAALEEDFSFSPPAGYDEAMMSILELQ
jgi:L,D-transpeptidase YcbB